MEALGLLAAHKAGVNPACLTPEITPIRDLEVYMEDLEDPPAQTMSGTVTCLETDRVTIELVY